MNKAKFREEILLLENFISVKKHFLALIKVVSKARA